MDMSWQAMLHDAAAVSFERNAESLATENRTRTYVDLSYAQIQTLSEKILSLPHEGIVLLLSRFCFHLSPEEAENFFPTEKRKGAVPLLSRAVIFLYGGQYRANDFR